MAKHELKWQNVSWNGKTQGKMAKRKLKRPDAWKRPNASQNGKTRVKTAKRKLKQQNTGHNGKTQVETAQIFFK